MTGFTCHGCGQSVDVDQAFCGGCGAPVVARENATAVAGRPGIGFAGSGSVAPASAPAGSAPGGGPQPATAAARAPAIQRPSGGWAGSETLGGRPYASIGVRFGALLIDGLVVSVAEVIIWMLIFGAASLGSAAMAIAVLLGLLALPAWFLWLMATRGTSPGKAMLGIQVVREAYGTAPGWGIALGRYLLRGLLLMVTFWIGGLSPLWDQEHRQRAWWDRAVGTIVVYGRGVSAGRTASPAHAPRAASADPSAQPWAAAPTATPGPPPPPRPQPVSPVTSPVPPPPAPPMSGSAMSAFAGPVVPPPPPPAAPLTPSPSPAGDAPDAGPARPAPLITRAPGRSAAAATGMVGAPAAFVAEDVEQTRLAPARTRLGPATWTVLLDDGRTVGLSGATLLGRDPAAATGAETLLAVSDRAQSVSKTHLRLDVGEEGVTVTDLHSTNGVAIVMDGEAAACEPGVAAPVPSGATVRFGDREFRLSSTQDPEGRT